MKLDIEKVIKDIFFEGVSTMRDKYESHHIMDNPFFELNIKNKYSKIIKFHIKEWLRDKLKNISDESTLHNAEIVSAQNNTLYKLIKELETG